MIAQHLVYIGDGTRHLNLRLVLLSVEIIGRLVRLFLYWLLNLHFVGRRLPLCLLAQRTALIHLSPLCLHHSIQVKVDQLLIGRKEFVTRTSINQLQAFEFVDIIIIKQVRLRQWAFSPRQVKNRRWFVLCYLF